MGFVRTTIDIPDQMYRRLKSRAAAEGRTVKSLLLVAAEHALTERAPRVTRKLRIPVLPSKRPGSLRLSNARIYDVISFP